MVEVVAIMVDVEERAVEVATVVDEEEEAAAVDHPFAVVVDELVGEAAVTVGEAVAVDKSPEVEADGAIIVNCTAKKIKAGKGAILYNLIDTLDEGIVAEDGTVRVAVMEESGESMLLKSKMDIAGGKGRKLSLRRTPPCCLRLYTSTQ
eukprot:scaffold56641_cov49-Attheya_sp.AAC.1